MSYKSLLTVVTDLDRVGAQIDAAAQVAAAQDAHLDVLCVGIDRTEVSGLYGGVGFVMVQSRFDEALADAASLAEATHAALARHDIRWAVRDLAVPFGMLTETIAQAARFSDLVVLPRPYGDGSHPDDQVLVESPLFGARVPVLVVPPGEMETTFGRRIVLAWNGSNEAMAATRAALPLLKAAEAVSVALIDPARSTRNNDRGEGLSTMLARHGVKAEIALLAMAPGGVTSTLAEHARDVSADLVVMGAYGHSRLREQFLGGATRDMLEHATLPLFLAH